MDVAVLGLGEAGGLYAGQLAGLVDRVRGFDPAPAPTPSGVERADAVAGAVDGADLVISFTGARASSSVAADAAASLAAGALYADFNTGSPEVKRRIGDLVAPSGALAADVAVLAPVPRAGVRTQLLVSGPGAERTAAFFSGVAGADASALSAPMGAAAGHKLLRSVFMKGLAAVVLEADEAAGRAGARDWLRAQMAGELGTGGEALVERLLSGTRAHAERRLHEVEDVADYLAELGAPSDVTSATTAWLARLVGDAPDAHDDQHEQQQQKETV